jgi:hypothetical protein
VTELKSHRPVVATGHMKKRPKPPEQTTARDMIPQVFFSNRTAFLLDNATVKQKKKRYGPGMHSGPHEKEHRAKRQRPTP